MAAPEGVNESGVAEQRAQRVPIKAQSTAVPVGTARICNAEWDDLGAMSGHGGFVHTLSAALREHPQQQKQQRRRDHHGRARGQVGMQ